MRRFGRSPVDNFLVCLYLAVVLAATLLPVLQAGLTLLRP